jgi:hypothetical protein
VARENVGSQPAKAIFWRGVLTASSVQCKRTRSGAEGFGLVSGRKRRARKVLARPDRGACYARYCEEGTPADAEGTTKDKEEAHPMLQEVVGV